MTMEQLREAHQARPFRPFKLCLADGREIDVRHPEFLLLHPRSARTFVVATSPESYRVVDLLLVTSLDFGYGRARRTRRR